MKIIFDCMLLILMNIGFVALVQQLMHFVDGNINSSASNPWPTELVYTAFFVVILGLVMGLSVYTGPNQYGVLYVNCGLLLMTNYVNLLTNQRSVVVAVSASAIIFAVLTHAMLGTILVLFTAYLCLALIQNRYFVPFDMHPIVRETFQLAMGTVTWLLLATQWGVHEEITSAIVSYAVSALACYGYMILLHNDHVSTVVNAHNVRVDALTGARNWMSFRNDTLALFEAEQPYAIVALDIDHFKTINDTFGHLTGNRALEQFAARINDMLHVEEANLALYRTGGEEFMIILPGTSLETATLLSQQCRQFVHELGVTSDDGRPVQVTVSIGVSATRAADERPTDVYRRADNCLYDAKRGGRDRVSVVE